MIHLETLEGHDVALDPADHAKLSKWPGIDLSRLHVVDDEVYPEVRGKRHSMSLEGLLALMTVPMVPTTPRPPEPSPVAPVVSDTPRSTPAIPRLQSDPSKPIPTLPKTGEPRGALAAFAKGLPPRVTLNGKELDPAECRPRFIDGTAQVCVIDQYREIKGTATLPASSYRAFKNHPFKPDSAFFKLGRDGRPTLRVKRAPDDMYPQAVEDFLAEHGLTGPVTYEALQGSRS
jgi:hypothetical protein